MQYIKDVKGELLNLRNDVNKKRISKNEDPEKIISIVEKLIDLNKQQKSRELKLLNLKQILQRLPIAFAQVKAGNTSENLLNKIGQIIYYLC